MIQLCSIPVDHKTIRFLFIYLIGNRCKNTLEYIRCDVCNYNKLLNNTCCSVHDRSEHGNIAYEYQWPQKMLGFESKH